MNFVFDVQTLIIRRCTLIQFWMLFKCIKNVYIFYKWNNAVKWQFVDQIRIFNCSFFFMFRIFRSFKGHANSVTPTRINQFSVSILFVCFFFFCYFGTFSPPVPIVLPRGPSSKRWLGVQPLTRFPLVIFPCQNRLICH